MRMPLSRVSLCLLFAYAKISAFAAPREKAMALSVRPLAMAAETKAEMRGGLAGTVPGRLGLSPVDSNHRYMIAFAVGSFGVWEDMSCQGGR